MGSQLSTEIIDKNNEIVFTLHGKLHRVSLDQSDVGVHERQKITPQTSLLTYLRDIVGMKDTKAMCREGGCGACIVAATFIHPHNNRKVTKAVNSCLVPILACHNWEITTVHGIGNRDMGYHPIQQALAQHNGTQCGFCSTGMAMNMYALTQSRDVLTMLDVEDAFGGNLCRCTGYRPIMDAFKSLADDADPALKSKFPDIEDLKICKKTNKICEGTCQNEVDLLPFYLQLDDEMHWYKVHTIQNILDFFKHIGHSTYRLVAGNTGQGVYKITDPPKYWVDIRSVKDLVTYKVDNSLSLGANITISDTMDLMQKLSEESNNKFWYLKQMWNHLDLVATVPVRNIGTLAGNLSLKHDHHEFPSDIFLLLETIGAEVVIVQENGHEVTKTIAEFIDFNMQKCVMKTIILPSIKKDNHLFRSYKIMPRAQNAHAHVNAGFLVEYKGDYKVTSARIVYGGINPKFIHATKTEKYLTGKLLFDDTVIQEALKYLTEEIKPDYVLPDPTPEFRKNLARNLFYKFILASAPKNKVNPQYKSGGTRLDRTLMSGVQLYQTDEQMYPVTKPVNKLEALIQCSGEAQYIDDMPAIPGELFGAFVLAEATPFTKIKKVDTSEAMVMPGVSAYISHKDIPGTNLYTSSLLNPTEEEMFCSGTVQYNGQLLGVIVADTYEHAVNAATKVHISYENGKKKAYYTIKSILKDKQTDRLTLQASIDPTKKGTDVKHVIKGTMTLHGQYHFTMETQRCLCIPTEDGGLDIYSSTQWMDQVQLVAANALNMTMDKINVSVRRMGGAYGAKILRSSLVSTACAVASYKMKRPVRLNLPLDVNMKVCGKRFPTYADYEVGVDDSGVVQYLNSNIYQAAGISGMNESMVQVVPHYMASGYNISTWTVKGYVVQTDMAGNGFCRAPGSSEAIALIENIMDHIATVVNKPALDVRTLNLSTTSGDLQQLVQETVTWSGYSYRLRQVDEYNSKNRWMKKGLSLVMMDYAMQLFFPYSVFVAVYAGDGTVAITHGGTESGQGINTKVVQVCAYELGIPMDSISVKPSNTLTAPNNLMTGGSVTSEGVCYSMIQACKELQRRLAPIKAVMKNPTWKDLVWRAQQEGVELCVTAMVFVNDAKTATSSQAKGLKPSFLEYFIPAACVCEVDVDLLTGEHVVRRVDLVEDVGQSLSLAIDAGQIEGAFIMGMGNYTCEALKTSFLEYFIPAACVCEVDVDLLTGEHVVRRVDLVEDVGQSMSPAIDAGQIEGAFIMGMGNYTCEALVYGDQGELTTYNTWTYKVPGVQDVPSQFNIMFKKNGKNSVGVLNSKATGEPAVCLSIGIPFAIRKALATVNKQNKDTPFLEIDGPFSVEYTLLNSGSNYMDFKL